MSAATDTAKSAEKKAREALAAALMKRAFQLRSLRRRQNVVKLATGGIEGALCIRGDEIDQQPHLLPTKNCVVDLRTGERVKPRPEWYLFKHTAAEWHGIEAPAPTWERFLDEIFEGNQKTVAFVQRALGCGIWGAVREHAIIVEEGRGRNGKGTKQEVLLQVLGDLAGALRAEILLDTGPRSAAAPSPDIMALHGMRLAFCSETNERAKVDTARVKWLTGGDTLRARNPNDKLETTWKPTHSLFLLTNSLPNAPADDFAFWNRVLVVNFPLSFVANPKAPYERQADTHLLDKLLAEGPGILAWLVRGCIWWQERGLDPPPEILERTAAYRQEVDAIGEFVDDCIIEDPLALTRAGEIYDVFGRWWNANRGQKVPSPQWMNKGLKLRFSWKKHGTLHFEGIKINPATAAELYAAAGA